jgi:hypothetical protein
MTPDEAEQWAEAYGERAQLTDGQACWALLTEVRRLREGLVLAEEIEKLRERHERAHDEADKYQLRALAAEAEVARLREAYDLLHKRIEAYDETHAGLQRLREENEQLKRDISYLRPDR